MKSDKRLTRWNGKKWVLPQGKGSFRRIAERLAAYENTGLTSDEIMELKEKKRTVTRVQRRKDSGEHMTARVTRYGIKVLGDHYWSAPLIFAYMGKKVDVRVERAAKKVKVFFQGELIETFALIV